jgi:hypothetical protein
MSKVSIEGNASGSGTFTIASPNSNTNRTLTLPDSTGTVVVSGTTPSLNGIAFPATQSASADANTLDDYEEGTWTPNQGAGLTVVGSFSSSGQYTKIGRVVTVRASLSGSTSVAIPSTDGILFTNLPFAVIDRTPGVAVNIAHTAGITLSTSSTTAYSCGTLAAAATIYVTYTYQV